MTSRRLIRRIAPILLALSALVVTAAIAFAYPPPSSAATETAGCTSVNPGASCSFTFHFVDGSGNGVTGETVTFTVTGQVHGTVSPTSAVTDPGDVSTTYTAGTGSACGTDTLTATGTSGTKASATITVPCTGGATLPATGTLPPGPSPLIYVLIALGVVVVLGGALTLRKTRPTTA